MVAQQARRASGEPGAVEEAQIQSDEMLQEVSAELPEERARHWRTPGMQRMRFQWHSTEERAVIDQARIEATRVITENFRDAYAVMYRIYDIVREPVLENGEPVVDADGLPVWRIQPDGWYIEDFTKLTRRQREDFLFSITTALFAWEQRAVEMWAEAMFSKAQFEERFAIAYDEPLKGTVDDRTAKGNMAAADERYFAIFMSVVSRKADAVVRSMERLSQRLKDTLQA